MISRPSNHVTRDMAERLAGQGSSCPDLTELMVSYLEAQFPPKCFNPDTTTEAQHHAYRGKVELVAMLRAQLTERHEGDVTLDPLVMPADLASA